MKLKYYLRGLGIGIIVTTIVLTVSNMTGGKSLSDEEIIERAEELGMVMENESSGNRLKDQMQNTEEDTQQTQEVQTPQSSEETQTSVETQTSEENTEAVASEGENGLEENGTGQEVGAEEPKTYMLVINAGAVCREVCDELQANGVIDDSEGLRKYLGDNGYAKQIHPGNFEIPYGISYEEIAQILLSQQ
ncbi:MAG: hypothetical protein ACI4ES_02295 [Roseburia sp.]